MPGYSRRDFLRISAAVTAGLGIGQSQVAVLAKGLEKIYKQQTRVLWLQGMSCSGCSVSFLNSEHPGPLELLTEVISLVLHQTVSAVQGDEVLRIVDKLVSEGNYVLILEGSLPLDMPEACVIGGKPLTTILPPVLRKAQAIVAAGTCAAFGGIPAAEGKVTGAASVKEFMQSKGIPTAKRLVNCPGCPVHPQALVATLGSIVGAGYPAVNPDLLTPDLCYKHSVHDECPRFHYWENNEFAERFGDEGCLFKLGCLGPVSHTACPRRQWNGGVNWCIRAGAPCIGCTSDAFAKKRTFAFYRKGEQYHEVAYGENERKGTSS